MKDTQGAYYRPGAHSPEPELLNSSLGVSKLFSPDLSQKTMDSCVVCSKHFKFGSRKRLCSACSWPVCKEHSGKNGKIFCDNCKYLKVKDSISPETDNLIRALTKELEDSSVEYNAKRGRVDELAQRTIEIETKLNDTGKMYRLSINQLETQHKQEKDTNRNLRTVLEATKDVHQVAAENELKASTRLNSLGEECSRYETISNQLICENTQLQTEIERITQGLNSLLNSPGVRRVFCSKCYPNLRLGVASVLSPEHGILRPHVQSPSLHISNEKTCRGCRLF